MMNLRRLLAIAAVATLGAACAVRHNPVQSTGAGPTPVEMQFVWVQNSRIRELLGSLAGKNSEIDQHNFIVLSRDRLNDFIATGEKDGKLKVLAAPCCMTQNNGETRFDFRTQIPAQINMGPNVGGAVFLEVSRSFRLTSKITRSRSIKLDVQIDSVTPDFGRFPVGGLLYDAELRKLVTPPETITRRSEVSAVVPAGGSLAIRRVNADLPDGDAELLALFTPKS